MATYKVDERDVHFNIFEYLNIKELTAYDKYKDQNEELYKMILNEGLKFALSEFDPLYVAGDREECHMKDGVVIVPKGYKEAYAKFAENGFVGIDTPPTYGGQGLPCMINTATMEFFTGSNVPLLLYAGLSRGVANILEAFGSPELCQAFCANLYNGKWSGTMCLTEPQAGSAVGDIRTSAKKNADGTYTITGNKLFITGGDQNLTENIIHTVLARVEGDAPGTKGISLFLVPKIWVKPDGTLGERNDVNCVNVEHKMGIKASATCTLNFGEEGKCRGFLIGEQSRGMKMMFQMMNEARLMCGVQGEALAATAYENALAYAKERIQGANTAIINYPNVRRELALCKAWVEGMRGLLYLTGKSIDLAHGHPDDTIKEKAKNRVELLTPICKAYCSDVGFKITEMALQIYGGYGYVSEYPIEQYMRDVKIASIYEGANGIQALDLMGRKLASKAGQLFREFYEDLTQFVASQEGNTELKNEISALKKAIDTVAQVAMKIAEWGMSGEKTKPMLSANYFLELTGHTTLAYILLDQARVAQAAISNGSKDSFYRNKIRTARFFVAHVLPMVQMRAKNILSEDLSSIEMEF
ncbi:MAG: acyl-CoA dehydrogenase [Deltaproteobacteria bacterium]|nr:acyl-CoA dehydrogenase [Deltaproteobacteria bacterium]